MPRYVLMLLAFTTFVSSSMWWRTHREARQLRAELAVRTASTSSPAAPAAVAIEQQHTPADRPTIAAPPAIPAAAEPIPSTSVQVIAVDQPSSPSTPPMTEDIASAIERFDMAMDREFERIEERERAATDIGERSTLDQLKARLTELDELYRRADTATDPAERAGIRRDMQATMGSILGLTRRDRDERLARLATGIGYNDPAHVQQFVQEVDRIYAETHMDWTKLFNRAPPAE